MSAQKVDLKVSGYLPAPDVMDAVDRIAWRLVSGALIRQIEETRRMGNSDTEIVDTLLHRLKEGWYG